MTQSFTSFWWHSIDLGNGQITPGAQSHAELQQLYRALQLPEDLTKRTLLDIGCWDGFYTFEAERHGAQVTAVDYRRPANFFVAKEALRSNAAFQESSVYDLGKSQLGAFDIVLFLGVLHHLRHPLLALEQVCEVTRDFAVIESQLMHGLPGTNEPLMRFYEFDNLDGQHNTWWTPTVECLAQMIRAAGFARVQRLYQTDTRVALKAFRNWNDKPQGKKAELFIHDVTNSATQRCHFPRNEKDLSLSIFVEGLPAFIKRWETRVEIGGFGAYPVYVGASFNPQYPRLIQINVLLPSGLLAGKHLLQVWHEDKLSNDFFIEVT